jgi:hypothetical protein
MPREGPDAARRWLVLDEAGGGRSHELRFESRRPARHAARIPSKAMKPQSETYSMPHIVMVCGVVIAPS